MTPSFQESTNHQKNTKEQHFGFILLHALLRLFQHTCPSEGWPTPPSEVQAMVALLPCARRKHLHLHGLLAVRLSVPPFPSRTARSRGSSRRLKTPTRAVTPPDTAMGHSCTVGGKLSGALVSALPLLLTKAICSGLGLGGHPHGARLRRLLKPGHSSLSLINARSCPWFAPTVMRFCPLH